MQQSNTYIIIFTLIMTIFFGTLLSFTRMKLAPIQKVQVEIDTKKKILGAVMDISSLNPEEILETYENKMSSKVLDIKGNELSQEDGNIYIDQEVNISKNYKINKDERLYPVFMYSNDGSSIDFYIFPMFGNGLWDWISGFIALDKDLNEIVGVAGVSGNGQVCLANIVAGIQQPDAGKIIVNQNSDKYYEITADIHNGIGNKSCDLATVYRCIVQFENSSLVERRYLGDEVLRYEFKDVDHHHHHIVCRIN